MTPLVGTKPPLTKLECRTRRTYLPAMDDTPSPAIAPPGWLEALAESEADLCAGRIVPGETVLRDLRESLARLEAKQAARKPRKATPRR